MLPASRPRHNMNKCHYDGWIWHSEHRDRQNIWQLPRIHPCRRCVCIVSALIWLFPPWTEQLNNIFACWFDSLFFFPLRLGHFLWTSSCLSSSSGSGRDWRIRCLRQRSRRWIVISFSRWSLAQGHSHVFGMEQHKHEVAEAQIDFLICRRHILELFCWFEN